jgi:hypothetical protein
MPVGVEAKEFEEALDLVLENRFGDWRRRPTT